MDADRNACLHTNIKERDAGVNEKLECVKLVPVKLLDIKT